MTLPGRSIERPERSTASCASAAASARLSAGAPGGRFGPPSARRSRAGSPSASRYARSPAALSAHPRRSAARSPATADGATIGPPRHTSALRHAARRPQPCKLWRSGVLRELVAAKLALDCSPQQIAGWLKVQHPDEVGHPDLPRDDLPDAPDPGARGAAARALGQLGVGHPLRRRAHRLPSLVYGSLREAVGDLRHRFQRR